MSRRRSGKALERGTTVAERTGQEALRRLCERLGQRLSADASVRLAYLHGSRARGAGRSESDIDLGVLLDDECVESPTAVKDSIWRLSAALGREVPSERLDLVLLNQAPALLRHRVIGNGIVLFARSEAERVRFVLRTIREYQDLEPRLREHTRRRMERLEEGRGHGGCGDLLETARRAGRLLGAPAATR